MPELAANSIPDTSDNTGGAHETPPGTVQHIRALAMPFTKTQMITEPDGSLLIKDFPVLVEGTWTDSAVRTPLKYTAKSLESYATNWADNSVWNRHTGGMPRPITDKIGEVVNPHYGRFLGKDNQEHNAVLSDVRIWPYTQNQRDAQEMVRHGLIKFGSVEHGPDPEKYNSDLRMNESTSLTFRGMALVNAGACKLCRVNEEAPRENADYPWDQCIEDQMKEGNDEESAKKICGSIKARNNSQPEETMAETKELEEKIATLTKELEAVKAQKPAEVKIEIPKELSELPGQMKELAAIPAVLKAMSDRLDALEKSGTSKTTTGAPKELSEAEPMNYHVSIDRKAGTIRAV
jgi:uncharacterized small protein (DUF1192 family)